jgi:hypothetical protein
MSDSPMTVVAIRDLDHGQSIDLIFEGESGERRAVNLARPMIPSLITLLQSRTEAGSVTPINRGSVFEGQRFALQAYRVIPQTDGSAQIVFYLKLPDQNNRGVTFPLDLTPEEARDLAKVLSGS